MSVSFDLRKSATAFDQASTVVTVLELSGKTWLLGAVVPGVSRRPKKSIAARDLGAVAKAIEGWKAEASRAGRAVFAGGVGFRSRPRRLLDRAGFA